MESLKVSVKTSIKDKQKDDYSVSLNSKINPTVYNSALKHPRRKKCEKCKVNQTASLKLSYKLIITVVLFVRLKQASTDLEQTERRMHALDI